MLQARDSGSQDFENNNVEYGGKLSLGIGFHYLSVRWDNTNEMVIFRLLENEQTLDMITWHFRWTGNLGYRLVRQSLEAFFRFDCTSINGILCFSDFFLFVFPPSFNWMTRWLDLSGLSLLFYSYGYYYCPMSLHKPIVTIPLYGSLRKSEEYKHNCWA